MKSPWLMTVTTQEGDHEYRSHQIIQAEDYKDALNEGNALVSAGDFDFQDGLTMSKMHDVVQITDEQAALLRKLMVA